MKLSILVLFLLLINLNTYAQNSNTSKSNINIMEMILFLNSNHLPDGASSFKADRDKKNVQYFDKDGRLFQENYIDENNNIISKNYDKNGGVTSETKITKKSIMDMVDQNQKVHNQTIIPIIKSTLQSLSDAAEAYAKSHNYKYPIHMKNLIEGPTQYLKNCTCENTIEMYNIWCEINENGYKFVAKSRWPQYESHIVSTGGIWEVKKPGELSRDDFRGLSPSPCEENSKRRQLEEAVKEYKRTHD